MSGNLGPAYAIGVLSAANKVTSGAWVVTFTPAILGTRQSDFEVWHGAIRGPGGYFLVYVDELLYGVGENGAINEYSPNIAMYIRSGQTITLHWSIATGTAPQAWLYLRQPESGAGYAR